MKQNAKRNCAMRLHAHWILYLHQVARLGSCAAPRVR